jgi:hypothetical protein
MAQRYLGKARRPATSRGGSHERNRANPAEKPREQTSTGQWDDVKGEGNYKAAREFDEAEREFVQSGKLGEAARHTPPASDKEQREMEDAEASARQRAREEDPALLKKRRTTPER